MLAIINMLNEMLQVVMVMKPNQIELNPAEQALLESLKMYWVCNCN